MIQTDQEYYEGENLGGYQYMPLSDIIDDFVFQSHDDQTYLYGTSRSIITRHVKSALQTIHKDTAKDFKALELSIGEDLRYKLPKDFVDYARVSLVTANSTLVPLDINYNLNTVKQYLQDNEYRILFDDQGDALESNEPHINHNKYNSYQVSSIGNGGHQQLDTSQISKYGEFTINKRAGIIYFSSNLQGEDIVVEYNSDGMDWDRLESEEITFHKHLKDVISDLTYYNCIGRKSNVPYYEKREAKKQFITSRHQAKVLMAEFDLKAIGKIWRKGSKWV